MADLHIEHLQSCAPNFPVVDRLLAKLFPQSRYIKWLHISDDMHSFLYRKVSAPWRTNCPACSVMAGAMKFFWPDEELKARSYGWSLEGSFFNTQSLADYEHLDLFTKPGQ